MGKYMKKVKITGEVSVMEVAQSSLGVRTRAKTLALQRLQRSKTASTVDSGTSYLQLRSRRLEKKSAKANPNSRTSSRLVADSGNSCSVAEEKKTPVAVEEISQDNNNNNDVGLEASFGENVLENEGRERSTRETTPCSLIRDSDTIGTPGSTTRPQRVQNVMRRNMPTTHEIEEFFAGAEQQQQRLFTEKYNFNPVNDMPLPGRYEWVRVEP